ncbi:iron ABC transporter permease [Nocardioides sp. TRM66260-LWL]|uniref:FecCD family ABC transporter permease n=1 Tax=Nocardioides sp. TRM66260-LWL TaxID=2874478 RepID=UPI001CC391AA|nr:iron ABC transporter permease [Nocardioides sp. TRM66260-LWL]MBZ5733099.1 iron ABC transporter permease [Nocardioides sp. TRM66260-LWL]
MTSGVQERRAGAASATVVAGGGVRLGAVLGVALLALGAAVVASLALGARDVAPQAVWQALVAPRPGDADHLVVRDLRVPRTLVGLLAGTALALAGALLQGLTRNPIADPGLLGVNAGSSLAIVLGIAAGLTAPLATVGAALGGAAAATAVVYAAAQAGWEGATPVRLALVGAAVTAAATSVVTLVLLSDRRTLGEYRFWQVGSLDRRLDLGALLPVVGPCLLLGVLLAALSTRLLDALALGDDVARGLGHEVVRGRLGVVVASVLLCGPAVALVGPIGFVGLVAPHLARAVVGPAHRGVLLLAAVLGPTLLLAADVLGRLVARPGELEAGVVVAALGAPALLLVVRRGRAVG